MRLDKYITLTMNVTRTEAKKIIKDKLIAVNEKIITDSGFNVNDNDVVTYQRENLIYKENIYIMMNKKDGFICANNDNYHQTVFSFIDNSKYNIKKLFTVGRLDIDTTGLLLITTDGDITHKLTSPKSNISKKYYVEVDGVFPDFASSELEKGVKLKDENGDFYISKPAFIEFIGTDKRKAYITVTEGKFHEVKKMCGYFGLKVVKLHRQSIGSLSLDANLKPGEYRELTSEELKQLVK